MLMEYSKMVCHVCDNDPIVLFIMSMVGIQMVYKSCCCRSYSCWLCSCYYTLYNINSFLMGCKI